jgi:F-type H+-transporting ATPase subunit delta
VAIKASEIELLSNRYSKAIFFAARDNSKLEQVNKDLMDISKGIASNPDFEKMLESGAVVADKMKEIFNTLCNKAGVDELTKNFLSVLAENKRGFMIPKIAKKLNTLILDDSNTVLAEVTSTKKLGDAELTKVKDSLKKSLGKNIITENKIDNSLIGGLKVKIGSTLFDDSVSSKLERLKQALATN